MGGYSNIEKTFPARYFTSSLFLPVFYCLLMLHIFSWMNKLLLLLLTAARIFFPTKWPIQRFIDEKNATALAIIFFVPSVEHRLGT